MSVDMNSSRKINYSTRVAKNIERKMIRDLLARYSSSYVLDDYTYIGFGAKYFTDFLMMHKYLHINKLISIEGDIGNKSKYEFNKPLNCIEMRYGLSNEVLPELQFDKNKSIVWLDYDGLLSSDCLSDVANLIGRLEAGAILFISYNSRPPKIAELTSSYSQFESSNDRIMAYLKDTHGENYLPHDLDLKGIGKWSKYSAFLRSIVINCINKRLEVINRGESNKLKLKQLVNFNYQDGCEMSSLGFTFFRTEQDELSFNSINLQQFDFYRDGDLPYLIDVPILTMKEIKALLEIMPTCTSSKKKELEKVIPPSEIQQFSKIYKYLPIFTDSELI
jgi:hypothetical protein